MEFEQEIHDKGVAVRPVLARVDSLVAKNVHEVLALTHMDRIFEIYDDIDSFLSKKAA